MVDLKIKAWTWWGQVITVIIHVLPRYRCEMRNDYMLSWRTYGRPLNQSMNLVGTGDHSDNSRITTVQKCNAQWLHAKLEDVWWTVKSKERSLSFCVCVCVCVCARYNANWNWEHTFLRFFPFCLSSAAAEGSCKDISTIQPSTPECTITLT